MPSEGRAWELLGIEDGSSWQDDGDSRRLPPSHQVHCSVGHKRRPWSLIWDIPLLLSSQDNHLTEGDPLLTSWETEVKVTGLTATVWTHKSMEGVHWLGAVRVLQLCCLGGRPSSLPVGKCLPPQAAADNSASSLRRKPAQGKTMRQTHTLGCCWRGQEEAQFV